MDSLTLYIQILWTSIANSSYLVLLTVAFAMVLKVLGVWNFAQPGMMAFSFYCMFAAIYWFGAPIPVAIGFALLCCCAFAYAIESYGFTTLRNRNAGPIVLFIFTFVISQFIHYLMTLIFTAEPRFLLGNMMSTVHVVFGVYVTSWDLSAIGVTMVIVAALYWFLNHTRTGQFMIAVSDNAELAETYGVNTARYYVLTMLIAAFLVTIAMFLFGTKIAFFSELSFYMILFAIAATIIGGIGNVFGAAAAAVGIVIIQQMSVLFVGSRWQPFLVFVILFVTIVFFPKGLRFRART